VRGVILDVEVTTGEVNEGQVVEEPPSTSSGSPRRFLPSCGPSWPSDDPF